MFIYPHFQYMEQRRLKALARAHTYHEADADIEESTTLLTDHIALDVDDIMGARRVMIRKPLSSDTFVNGGLFDFVLHVI